MKKIENWPKFRLLSKNSFEMKSKQAYHWRLLPFVSEVHLLPFATAITGQIVLLKPKVTNEEDKRNKMDIGEAQKETLDVSYELAIV